MMSMARTTDFFKTIGGKLLIVWGLVCPMIVLTPAPAKADTLAYDATSTGEFGLLDLTTGAFTQIATTPVELAGFGEIGASLYSAEFSGNPFYGVNGATGNLTTIASSGLNGGIYQALGSSTTALYALDGEFNLYSVNPGTGASTEIGSGPTATVGTPGDYTLSSGSSSLYFTESNEFYSVDVATSVTTDIGPTGTSGGTDGGFGGMVFEDGTLYGVYVPNVNGTGDAIYTIDPSTGAATFVAAVTGETGDVNGLAPATPTPGPDSLSLVIAGLFALLAVRRWKLS
jgi:hypothetical protein